MNQVFYEPYQIGISNSVEQDKLIDITDFAETTKIYRSKIIASESSASNTDPQYLFSDENNEIEGDLAFSRTKLVTKIPIKCINRTR